MVFPVQVAAHGPCLGYLSVLVALFLNHGITVHARKLSEREGVGGGGGRERGRERVELER